MAKERTILDCKTLEQVGEGTKHKVKLDSRFSIALERKNPIARFTHGNFSSEQHGTVLVEDTFEDSNYHIRFKKVIELSGNEHGAILSFDIKRNQSVEKNGSYYVFTRVCQKENFFQDIVTNNCANYDCKINVESAE